MMDWQTIDSAPKNRKVLAGYRNKLGNWRTVIACYYGAGTLHADESWDDQDEDGYAPAGWYEECETHEFILLMPIPTHWMHMPLPPVLA